MGRYDGILIASDFDRTLTDPAGAVPERNRAAIRRFMAEGGWFTVASGRSVPMFRQKRLLFESNAPTILYNGAICYDFDTERVVFGTPLPEMMPTVRELMARYPLKNIEWQGVTGHYALRIEEEREKMFRELGVRLLKGPYDALAEPMYMLFLGGTFIRPDDPVRDFQSGTPEADAMMEACVALTEARGDVFAVRSTRLNTEIMAKGISKGSAARRLANQLGCHTLVCVGDAQNDLAMLLEADLCFTPADGDASIRPQVGERLRVTAPCTEGTLADVVEKL